jgi:hypothetical protein
MIGFSVEIMAVWESAVLFAYIFSFWHLLIVVAVICVLFPRRLFESARGLGSMMRQMTAMGKSKDVDGSPPISPDR